MIVKSDAIVLRTMKYGDTSKIVTIFTLQYGKIRCIAKGARASKNKFGTALEPLQVISTVIYKKDHRELHLMTQADPLYHFRYLTTDLETLTATLSIAELVNRVIHHEEPHPALFHLVLESLRAIDAHPAAHERIVHRFQLNLSAELGFAPSLSRCGQCGTPAANIASMERVAVQIAKGFFLCPACSPSGLANYARPKELSEERRVSAMVSVSAECLKYLRSLVEDSLSVSSSQEVEQDVRREAGETLRLYLRYHVEGLKPLHSEQLLNSLSHQEV